jgi:hypothetical protein
MKRTATLLSLLLAAALSGCVVAPPRGYGREPGVYLSAPRVEVVAPSPGFFWIEGLWRRDGGHRNWQHGHWEHNSHGHGSGHRR